MTLSTKKHKCITYRNAVTATGNMYKRFGEVRLLQCGQPRLQAKPTGSDRLQRQKPVAAMCGACKVPVLQQGQSEGLASCPTTTALMLTDLDLGSQLTNDMIRSYATFPPKVKSSKYPRLLKIKTTGCV